MNCSNLFHDHGNCDLCARFARILESSIIQSSPDLCVITRVRNISPTIAGIPTRSPLVINALFSFEPVDKCRALNLGETVILQEEINPFIDALREQDIIVTALHNHWLFEDPRLFYIHFFSIEDPITFAKKVAAAFEILENGYYHCRKPNHTDWQGNF
ncbi:MAG: DUF1259 domain-containing protein [Bacillota bacterium]